MNKLPCQHYHSDRLSEAYRVYKHPSGLDIYIFPKKMTTAYALFGTKYGSIDNSFVTKNGDRITVPDGIAHFLEHKLFSNEDGSDSFEHFSAYGADANAYTSFNKTVYLFSCTDCFEESLAELIRFVTHPYFTPESVASEVGIISEEIRMYDDSPSDRCFYGMLEAMYEHHSIRRNICGSAGSIAKITPELLYECYHTFYQLSNMALVICGNVNDEDVLRIANEHLPRQCDSHPIGRLNENIQESPAVFRSYIEQTMQVAKPLFNIGFKDTDIPADGTARQRKDAAMAILSEMLFSRAGELYQHLFDTGMISPNLSYGYTISESSAYSSIAGEADDPKAVLQEIRSYLDKIALQGLSREDFERGKKVMYAEFVKSFDSTDSIANNLFSFICDDCELLGYADLIDSVTFEEVSNLFSTAFLPSATALSVVLPIQDQSSQYRKETL